MSIKKTLAKTIGLLKQFKGCWKSAGKQRGKSQKSKKNKKENGKKSEEESYINEDRNTFFENAKNFPPSKLAALVVGAYFNANILNSFLLLGVTEGKKFAPFSFSPSLCILGGKKKTEIGKGAQEKNDKEFFFFQLVKNTTEEKTFSNS